MWYDKHLAESDENSSLCKKKTKSLFSSSSSSSKFQNKIPVWQFLPLMAGILPFVGVTFTYYIAKKKCHLERWILPYVSYTGSSQPESMIFGMLFNVEGFICIWIAAISWRYYKTIGQEGILNDLNFTFGVVASFGVIIIANFQITAATTMHLIGAATLFIVGTMYSITMTIISRRCHRDYPTQGRFSIYVTRFTLSVIMTLSLCTLVTFVAYKRVYHDIYGYKDQEEVDDSGLCNDLFLVKSSNPEYNLFMDLTASIAEWVLITGMLACICVYYFEFRDIQMIKIQLSTCKENALTSRSHLNRSVSQPNLSISSRRSDSTFPTTEYKHAIVKEKR